MCLSGREYRYTDVFPGLSRDGKLVITEEDLNSSIAIMEPDGSNRRRIFEAADPGVPPALARPGLPGASRPPASPDGQWVVLGVGVWFQERSRGKATIMRV